MLSPSDVTAVIVTKGNVDLEPVLQSLIFDDFVIWDNSLYAADEKTYGRVLAANLARNDVIYSQDDDIIHTKAAQRDILAAYDEDRLTGCMWAEWSAGAKEQGIVDGYDDLVFPGSGSISHRDLWNDCVQEYLDEWPRDDFFRLWSDTIIGVIAPTRQLDIRFEALPCADDPDRMANMPDGVEQKTEAIRRARLVRDGVPT
jgi:hypothetical protein